MAKSEPTQGGTIEGYSPAGTDVVQRESILNNVNLLDKQSEKERIKTINYPQQCSSIKKRQGTRLLCVELMPCSLAIPFLSITDQIMTHQ